MEEPESRSDALARFQRALSDAVGSLGQADIDAATMTTIADGAERLAVAMSTADPAGIAWGFTTASADPAVRGVFVIGLAPLSVELRASQVGDSVEGTIVLPDAFRGPERAVHGGHIARILDDISAIARSVAAQTYGVTKRLEVRYLRPTPLNTPVTLRARVVSVDGREATVVASLQSGDISCAVSEAVFVRLEGA